MVSTNDLPQVGPCSARYSEIFSGGQHRIRNIIREGIEPVIYKVCADFPSHRDHKLSLITDVANRGQLTVRPSGDLWVQVVDGWKQGAFRDMRMSRHHPQQRMGQLAVEHLWVVSNGEEAERGRIELPPAIAPTPAEGARSDIPDDPVTHLDAELSGSEGRASTSFFRCRRGKKDAFPSPIKALFRTLL